MSEKLNFAFFCLSEKAQVSRKKIVENLMTIFLGILGQPKSILLLDWMTNKEFRYSWEQADSLLSLSLLPTNLLIIYFEKELECSSYKSSVRFENINESYSYVVSLPASISINIELILHNFCDIYATYSDNEIIILVGKEVEFSDEIKSIESTIEYALPVYSLVDWILVNDKYQKHLGDVFKKICCLNKYCIFVRNS